MKVLVAVDAYDPTHEIARVTSRLFPGADHVVVSAAVPTPYLVSEPLAGSMFTLGPTAEAMSAEEDAARHAAEDVAHDIEMEQQREIGRVVHTPSVESHGEMGPLGVVICDEAKAIGADVIVVGRRSRGWLSRLFDPSVTEYVLKHAPCPVLVVMEPKDDGAMADDQGVSADA